MQDLFSFVDELGPIKIVHASEPSIGLEAVLVVDNVAKGPSIGGVRMATDVTTEECIRLARAMTYKNAAAGLPHGGGKVVLRGDPKMPADRKEQLIRALAQLLRGEREYIFAPDMGTNEECMAWVRDEISRVVALPREIGGIPLDEIGATGWGLSHVVDVALHYCDFELEDARIVVQGFGAVGKHVAQFLTAKGARLVAVADSRGATHNPRGLDVGALLELKAAGKSVADYGDGTRLASDAVIDVECDIWIPAARPDVVNEDNVHRLKTRLVVEGANIPFTLNAEEYLHERGILCIPDFIANAGGVICAAMEYHGATQAAALQTIEEKLRRNTEQVMESSREKLILPRQAAIEMAEQRVRKAMSFRRFPLFSTAPDYTSGRPEAYREINMYRIRFHGRGGQGMKTASRILGSAFFNEGYEVQDAPRYGAERRGAPIFAYVRAAREPINERGIINRPDLVVVADDTLVPVPASGVLAGIDAHTVLLINTLESADTWRHRLNISSPVITLPASADVADRADIPYIGAACAGAAARLVGVLSRDALAEAIRTELAELGPAVIERNLENALEAFEAMAAHGGLVSEGSMISASGYDIPDWTELPFETARISSPTVFAVANSVEVRTGLWRTLRPVIDYDRCNRCWWVCSTFCPDGAIEVDNDGSPVIDYDNCKGCMICVAQCPPHAIEAVAEHEAQLAESAGDTG